MNCVSLAAKNVFVIKCYCWLSYWQTVFSSAAVRCIQGLLLWKAVKRKECVYVLQLRPEWKFTVLVNTADLELTFNPQLEYSWTSKCSFWSPDPSKPTDHIQKFCLLHIAAPAAAGETLKTFVGFETSKVVKCDRHRMFSGCEIKQRAKNVGLRWF